MSYTGTVVCRIRKALLAALATVDIGTGAAPRKAKVAYSRVAVPKVDGNFCIILFPPSETKDWDNAGDRAGAASKVSVASFEVQAWLQASDRQSAPSAELPLTREDQLDYMHWQIEKVLEADQDLGNLSTTVMVTEIEDLVPVSEIDQSGCSMTVVVTYRHVLGAPESQID